MGRDKPQRISPRINYQKNIPGNSRPLCLPIEPDTAITAVNEIITHLGVQGSVKLDSADFSSMSQSLMVNVVNTIILNLAEGTTHVTDDTGLFTVMDNVPADNMAAHIILVPTGVQSPKNHFLFTLGTTFFMFTRLFFMTRSDFGS